MSYSVSFETDTGDNDGPFDLCSISAWTRFSEYVKTLPFETFPKLAELVDQGTTVDTESLSGELAKAAGEFNPTNGAAQEVLAGLIEYTGVGDLNERVSIES